MTNIADVLPEPENGTRLVMTEYDGNQRIIWRDDAVVVSRYPTERWMHDRNDDPMEWRAILKYATSVYSIPDKPLATMPTAVTPAT